jgi:Na+-transporting NADH:ubiquinone oxidoreductase subunit F
MTDTLDRTARDYSIVGPEAQRAAEVGLVDAEWFRPPINPERMRELTERTNARAIADAALWVALLVGFGGAAAIAFPNPWSILLFVVYGALFGAADARWHEFGHGTACSNERVNGVMYQFASLILWRGPTLWRWSHFRHHSDTIIVGRDPEIQLTRPPSRLRLAINYTGLRNQPEMLWRIVQHAFGKVDPVALDLVPKNERSKIVWEARFSIAFHVVVVVLAVATQSWLPVLLVGLPTIYGAWVVLFFGTTQHLGLQEDVLDHRANSRTVYMNPVFRFLYLNMNYHVEHHIFPAVPYYRLPALHAEIKYALPEPSPNCWHAYREILGELKRQRIDPQHELATRTIPDVAAATADVGLIGSLRPDGSFDLGPVEMLAVGSITRVDVRDQTFAVARISADTVCVVDGICTHGQVHLAGGAIVDGADGPQIECPKHNGRFDLATGAPCRKPVKEPIAVHHADTSNDHIIIHPAKSDS